MDTSQAGKFSGHMDLRATIGSPAEPRTGAFSHHRALEHLVEVIQELSLARDLDAVTAIVRRAARTLTGAHGATFVLRDGDLCHYADEDAISPLWKGQRFPLNACISGWTMVNRQPAVIEDIYADPRIPSDAYRPTFVKSLVMVPIRREAPVGAIGNYWAVPHKASPEEVKVLQALADSTSVAMENGQLYGTLRDKNGELARANAALHAALRTRDEFLSIASHELRTPIAALKLQLQLLDRRSPPGSDRAVPKHELHAALNLTRRQVEALAQLVNELLDVSKIQLGRFTLHVEQVDLAKLVRGVVDRFADQLVLAGCATELALDADVHGRWDRGKMEQVVVNLLTNAIKYAPGTPVRIVVTRSGDTALLEVQDRGDGIAPQLHQKIFDQFERAVSATHVSGLGLGLYIVKKIVDAHGGSVRVDSDRGQGARFIVELPVAVASGAHHAKEGKAHDTEQASAHR